MGGRFNVLLEQQQSIEEMWKNTKEILCEAAEEVLGFKESEARKPWISQEVLDLSDRRKWLKKEKANGDRQIQLAYNKLTKEIHQKARQCKEEWLRNQCIEIQQASQEHATSKVYQKIKLISGEVTCKSLPVADKDGKLLQEKEAIKERWKEHFKGLYNTMNPVDEGVLAEIPSTNMTEEMDSFQQGEIEVAIRSLKSGKAPGVDNVTAEMIKAGGECTAKVMHRLCNKVLEEEQCPDDWGKAIIVPLHKKNDKTVCSNYRGISLLSVPGKVFTKALQQRLKRYVERVLSEEQAGFRQGRGTIDQIFVIRQLAEKYTESNNVLYNNFIDYKQAFDSVWQKGLWQVLRHYGIPEDGKGRERKPPLLGKFLYRSLSFTYYKFTKDMFQSLKTTDISYCTGDENNS